MVRTAEGPPENHGLVLLQLARNGVNLGDLQRLRKGQIRQNGRNPLGQHGLSRPRRSDQKQVVAARRGHLKGALGVPLALDLRKVQPALCRLAKERVHIHPG